MTERSIWGKAHDILTLDGWNQGSAVDYQGCKCAGSAIAEAITGDPTDLYAAHRVPAVELALLAFATHVGASYSTTDDDPWPLEGAEERVTYWNDRLDRATGYDIVLKALAEMDELERAR